MLLLGIADHDLPNPLSLCRSRRIRLPGNDHAFGRDGDFAGNPGELGLGVLGQSLLRPFAPHHGDLRCEVRGTDRRRVSRPLHPDDPRLGKEAAQISGVVAICGDERARLEALRLERGGKSIIGDGNAAFAAFRTHGMQRIAQPDRHHDQRDRDQHRGEHSEPSRGIAALLHQPDQP